MAAASPFILRGTRDVGRKTGDGGPFLTGQKWAKKPPGEGSRRVSGFALNPHTALPRTPDLIRGPLEGTLEKLTGAP